jgi:hypothetical protein
VRPGGGVAGNGFGRPAGRIPGCEWIDRAVPLAATEVPGRVHGVVIAWPRGRSGGIRSRRSPTGVTRTVMPPRVAPRHHSIIHAEDVRRRRDVCLTPRTAVIIALQLMKPPVNEGVAPDAC